MNKKKNAKIAPENPHLPLPAAFYRQGVGLIDQQMWCWGCDVRRDAGNLLIAYGAYKQPSPNPRYHSAYQFTCGDNVTLTLWGWGIWAASEAVGSLFLSRSRFRVRYSAGCVRQPMAWCEQDLPPTETGIPTQQHGAAYQLLGATLRWISDYERWVQALTPRSYRVQAIAAFPERRRYRGGVPAEAVATQWRELADMLPAS